ncbi:MAG TPA: type 1 glutamine amidotransferase domain-containing protein [Noviherbaspirillum sp.]
MDTQTLSGLNIAVLLTDGFEQVEFTQPRAALEQQGALIKIVSDKQDKVQGFHHHAPADQFDVDLTFGEADPKDFDALLLPGGEKNGNAMRNMAEAQRFVRAINEDGKPIAAICHGGWVLTTTGLAEGRTLTSWPSLQEDFRKAGGNWVDQEVVVDGNLVTSRKPDDLPAFNQKMCEVLSMWIRGNTRGTHDEHSGVGLSG